MKVAMILLQGGQIKQCFPLFLNFTIFPSFPSIFPDLFVLQVSGPFTCDIDLALSWAGMTFLK